MARSPRLTRTLDASELQSLALRLPTVDDYLQVIGGGRPNTWLATAYDLLVFFSVIPLRLAVKAAACTPSWPLEFARWRRCGAGASRC